MKLRRFGRSAAVLSIAALALTACGSDAEDTTTEDTTGAATAEETAAAGGEDLLTLGSGNFIGGGASSQEAAVTAWIAGVSEVNPNLTVQYNPVGSGNGRSGFIAGEYSFAGSDAAMDADEQAQAEAVCGPDGVFHIPAYISPVAVAFNLEGIDSVNMDAATIAGIFNQEITSWNDPVLVEQNPDIELPDLAITVVHRSDDSGTSENFTAYLAEAAPDAWPHGEVETWPEAITAESAQGTTGVVNLASSTEGAITYADASQVGGLGTVAVGVGDEYVPYSPEAAAAIVAASEEDPEAEGAVSLNRATEESGVYPIVLVSYSIYCHNYANEDIANQAKNFAAYQVSEEGQQAAADAAHSAPISDEVREAALERISAIGVQG